MRGCRHGCWMLCLLLLLPLAAAAQVKTLSATAYAGKRYVALNDLAALYGLPLKAPGEKKLVIQGQHTALEFSTDAREAKVNGASVWLHAPVYKVKGKWSISDADAQYVMDPLVRPTAYIGARGTRTVVLDAGHGGKDPGACSANGHQEKTLALDIASRVRAILQAAGVRVVMTREKDVFLELPTRPELANKAQGDIFVSIHLNATASRSVQGIETYVMPVEDFPPTSESKLTGKYPRKPNNAFNHSNAVLGYQIQKALVAITRADDRGLRRARFAVLRDAKMPAVLVECGFLSNPQEEKRLTTSSYRETLAQGIAQGILNYFTLVNQAKRGASAPLQQPRAPVVKPAPVVAPPVTPKPAPAPTPKPAPAPAPAPKPEPPPVVVPAPAPAAPAPVAPPPVVEETPAPPPPPKPVEPPKEPEKKIEPPTPPPEPIVKTVNGAEIRQAVPRTVEPPAKAKEQKPLERAIAAPPGSFLSPSFSGTKSPD